MGKELSAGLKLKEKYEIVRKYGTGSLGDDVYIGKHLELDREILIRILPVSMTSDKEIAQRFIQGVRLTASLQHPNILPAYDAGEQEDFFFFVTGFEKGFFLNEYLVQRGKLEEKEAVRIIIALSDALKFAWKTNSIIHRNVCPETILIARGNQPMLTDFGMAKSQASASQGLTMPGFTVGNPKYMSPEQVMAEKDIDFHADMYCLGLVFYEMLAGHPAFDDKSAVALMEAQTSKQPKDLKTINPQISDRCIKVINGMIEKDKKKRFSSWDELMGKLDGLLEDQKPDAQMDKKKEAEIKKKASEEADKKIKDVIRMLAAEKKRKIKRNITIIFIILNLIILALFIMFLMNKMNKPAQKDTDVQELKQ